MKKRLIVEFTKEIDLIPFKSTDEDFNLRMICKISFKWLFVKITYVKPSKLEY